MPKKKEIQAENLPELIKVAKISKTDQLAFQEFKKLATDWQVKSAKIVVNNVSQVEAIEQAKAGYDFLKNKYQDLEDLRKALGEESLRKTQAINGIGNYFKGLLEPILADLKPKAEFIKNAEKKSKDAIADKRLAELSEYGSTLARDIASSMTEDVYQNYLVMAKKTYNELFKEPDVVSNAIIDGVNGSVNESVKPAPPMMVGQVYGTKTNPAVLKPRSEKEKLLEFVATLNLLQYPDVENELVLLAFQNLDEAVKEVISTINKL